MAEMREAFVGIDVAKLRNAVAVADAGRDGRARVPEPDDKPVQAVAGRAGLVADAQRARRAPPCMKTARWRVAMAELGSRATARSVSSR